MIALRALFGLLCVAVLLLGVAVVVGTLSGPLPAVFVTLAVAIMATVEAIAWMCLPPGRR